MLTYTLEKILVYQTAQCERVVLDLFQVLPDRHLGIGIKIVVTVKFFTGISVNSKGRNVNDFNLCIIAF